MMVKKVRGKILSRDRGAIGEGDQELEKRLVRE
jgi:hypothetical protein